jgi:hypothetical protein
MVTTPVALILSKVVLEAIALCEQTSNEATNGALIAEIINNGAFIIKPSQWITLMTLNMS